MRCPSLNDLPSPPPDKTGWPWTEETPQLPDTMPDGSSWPRIGIVTPSYNQEAFIEETIRSVLLQGYPNLEYVVIDGGSADDSVAIIRQYAPWLTHWVSEPDNGQAHAIDKGFARCTADLLGWINSDDLLLPGAVGRFSLAHQRVPEAILLGDVINFHEESGYHQLLEHQGITFDRLVEPWRHDIRWHQPGIYFPRTLYRQAGSLDETLRCAFDRDWMCRALQIAPVHYLHVPVARFRLHDESKTMRFNWFQEESMVTRRYWRELPDFDLEWSEAALQVYHAATHLRLRYWDRGAGIEHLSRAVRRDWRVLVWCKFWLLCLKALLPLGLLQKLRLLHLRFFKRVLWLIY
jgi:glycosyltransferase involved in cell wall biosynthesis